MEETPIFPQVATISQSLVRSAITDPDRVIDAAFSAHAPLCRSQEGETVAVAVGSRKIDRLAHVTFRCLRFLEERGFSPFIVPAMGSHGGATPDGQRQVLAGLGITEASMKVPIQADMAARPIDTHACGMEILFSEAALAADYVVVINRIKPHTKFRANIESGLCKMLTVGLGKAAGAQAYHRYAIGHSFGIIESAARQVMNRIRLLFGVALVEDGYGRLARIEIVTPEILIETERSLLKTAASMMGRIPFDPIDVLVVDHIGKDISGIGMDSNVTGRHRDLTGDFCRSPHVRRIFVRDLSPGSDGNANGIGLADFTTRRLVERLDYEKTRLNAVSAVSPEKAALPLFYDCDREALEACLSTCGAKSPETVRLVRIRDTASLEYLQVSRALERQIEDDATLTRLTPWQPISWDAQGNLEPFIP
ncbi:MAG: DUF362 domain-containing protein [Desulfococcus sp. 4484_241]|nr:MAG: DUF362 domain-containing protein [Desulfococcus sp. 4484_241]